MDSGLFITFEGSEGCGKSTQFERLLRRLEKTFAGRRPVVTAREPGGTPLGEEIRRVVKLTAPGWSVVPESELLLFAASRAQLVRTVIAPALAEGAVVLCDRFLDSTTVYQGVARHLAAEDVALINRFAAGSRLPDVTFVCDLPAEIAMERLKKRPRPAGVGPDRLESEPLDFYREVRAGYLRLAQAQSQRMVVIDAAPPADEIEAAIWAKFNERFHGFCSADGV